MEDLENKINKLENKVFWLEIFAGSIIGAIIFGLISKLF